MNTGGESSYTAQQWENAIAARVCATMASPEMERYFSIRMTAPRAHRAPSVEPVHSMPERLLGQFDRKLRCIADEAAIDGA